MPEPITAITICQPYAHLIVHGEHELPVAPNGRQTVQKRVENRTWSTDYRGPLAIHAGQSRKWFQMAAEEFELEDGTELDCDIYGLVPDELTYGAVVGVADLVGCFPIRAIRRRWTLIPEPLRWLYHHEHCEGPVCWVLENIRRLKTPIPARGQQQLWHWEPPVPLDELEFCHE